MASFNIRQAMRDFLKENEPRLVFFLVTMWQTQERAITYKELREAILAGDIDPEWLEDWQQDYAHFVSTVLQPYWLAAIDDAAGQWETWLAERMEAGWYDPNLIGIQTWVTERAASFVTNSTQTQIDAIRVLVQRAAQHEVLNVDQLARAIRPTVGLTKPQAVANMKYYEKLIEGGMSQKRAQELQIRYAARQHRYRGYNIARTELAFSYNKGALDGAKQAQDHGLLGDCVKRWSAVLDERTCDRCRELNGKEIAMDEEFDFPTKLAATNPGIRLTPPAHPSCRCNVEYVEITPPIIKEGGGV